MECGVRFCCAKALDMDLVMHYITNRARRGAEQQTKERIMKIEFTKPVSFSTISLAFAGEGIPPVPADAARIVVSNTTTAYVAVTGEAWECFNGRGTTETSETYYWPSLEICPRAWAKELAA